MNTEEMREHINLLENTIKENNEKIEYLELTNSELKQEVDKQNDTIKDLKLKNYELFTQIPRVTDMQDNKKEEYTPPNLNDLINKMK